MVLGACTCWGAENNCTRNLSIKDPSQVVAIKGIGSGVVSLGLAMVVGERMPGAVQAAGALLPGFISYGTSILLYVYSQRILGAARTATYYASAPFIGAGISFFVFRQPPTCLFVLALALMGAWAAVALCESQSHRHKHAPIEHDHRHAHLHQKNT